MVEPSKPGIRLCMKCGWNFVSPDVLRIGRCQDCRSGEDSYSPRTVNVQQVHTSASHNYSKDTS